ncbi:MAG: hypothetical protein AVDCRST_MAG71-2298 [uncultured Lysobacter sp.]|uniref:Uncharacterized protein n=1 Tax=uncultured Lysobacter sp. TaxID=271060 RepID=A0A6J4LTZ7_9GAMM|nr:MAG: hypothetical protein AVDCRST_MAG71-2298 [uncultured Lysobacter sp.]
MSPTLLRHSATGRDGIGFALRRKAAIQTEVTVDVPTHAGNRALHP